MVLGRRRELGWSLGEGWGREPVTPPLYVPSEEPSQATEEPGPLLTALASYARQEEHDAVGRPSRHGRGGRVTETSEGHRTGGG